MSEKGGLGGGGVGISASPLYIILYIIIYIIIIIIIKNFKKIYYQNDV